MNSKKEQNRKRQAELRARRKQRNANKRIEGLTVDEKTALKKFLDELRIEE